MEGEASKRIAVVTGGNQGIGLEIVKQLASNGIMVLLTAIDEKRGTEAVEKLKDSGFSDVVSHQLDVSDTASVATFADFIKTQFGKLDILVNNAAVLGILLDLQDLDSSTKESMKQGGLPVFLKLLAAAVEDYEKAEECLNINYYGTKKVIDALMPLLQLSHSPRIVNVSSDGGKLQRIPSERIRREFSDVDGLSEEKLDELLQQFLSDFKAKNLEEHGWPTPVSAYRISKVALNALTRILAKKYPKFCINCVHPGFVKTDITFNAGTETVEQGAKGPVMLALLPDGGPSGFFYDRTSVSTFVNNAEVNGFDVGVEDSDSSSGVTVKEINGSGSLTAKALKYLPRFTLSSITDGHLVNIGMVGVAVVVRRSQVVLQRGMNYKVRTTLSSCAELVKAFRQENFLEDWRLRHQFLQVKSLLAELVDQARKSGITEMSSLVEKKQKSEAFISLCEARIAVVTGANKGIGLEIVKQLASNGIMVLLTARDEKRGTEAVEKLKDSGFSDVVFHQLDVSDSASIASLADFIKTEFGKLDILVNNAAVNGISIDLQDLDSSTKESIEQGGLPVFLKLLAAAVEDYEKAEECLNINYYGTKKVIDALMPFLQLSHLPRIVNVSSAGGKLQHIPSESIRREFSEADDLSEEKLDELLQQFLSDFKAKNLEENGWPTKISAYIISKAALNALTRILAKKYPKFCINCVHPGFVNTEMSFYTGTETVEEAAKGPVMLALFPDGGPSGFFYDHTLVSTFE
ncbi:uncharacterized protein LOC120275612 [Dioscorea cayenensis subsp. rotundata]|uniref:Uncharacterized protein LOC120275612 n=1 Tax=Dioscorea cayennensis subsp. rotundata TaxID=55577 RepID=A0AB40CE48_DIOCR|nr:uncharacterized protein LOC120275612 [Dioscorea cayenensis subsp. rotundata]